MSAHPYIGVVAVARNDNYGGDFLHRTNVFVSNIVSLFEKYAVPSELVLVEWNPPPDRPPLREALAWPAAPRRYCAVRIVHVPPEIHQTLANPSNLRLFEYLGKNVGSRRSNAEFVLVTNPDVVFSEELASFLAARRLSTGHFYRVDRYDVRPPVPAGDDLARQLEYCRRNVVRICGRWHTFDTGNGGVTVRQRLLNLTQATVTYRRSFPRTPLHTNASGDFFLVHRSHWENMRGYPELERQGKSHQIDGTVLYMALLARLRQHVLPRALHIYHQDHGRPDNGKARSPAVEEAYRALRSAKAPIIMNAENWGLADLRLAETVL